jgi:hypothetical protein
MKTEQRRESGAARKNKNGRKDMEKEMTEICETLQAAGNEGTRAPYWLIIDPYRQVMELDDNVAVFQIANMVTGPFFSRETAEAQLNARKKSGFSSRARVFCASGWQSRQYDALCNALEKEIREKR